MSAPVSAPTSTPTSTRGRTTAGRREVVADGSPVPARLRIVAWITLASGLGLLAVVLTVRSALLTEVERATNDDVTQEVDEFRTFAREGRDPDTGERFDSAPRLIELYLERQFPGRGEVLVGWDLTAADPRPILQGVPDQTGLTDELDDLAELVRAPRASGFVEVDDRRLRWARAEVVDGDGRPAGVFLVAASSEPRVAEVGRTVRLIVLVSLGGLLLTALIAFAVAGQILAPVRAVRRAAAAITRTDLQQRIEVRGRDDLGALASTFNAMLDRLESSLRAQHRFTEVAARHLTAPLAVLEDPAASARARAEAADALRGTWSASRMLTASQLPGFADPTEHRARDLVRDLLAHAGTVTPDHAWEASPGTDDVEGTVAADAGLLRVAVGALAVNAAAEHRGDAPLRLGATGDGDHLEVWVEDDGPGLDAERAQHVLDRYTDLAPDGAATGDPWEETGLGLALVRAVADAHEGVAWVETAPGEGARFGLRLPRHPGTGPGEAS